MIAIILFLIGICRFAHAETNSNWLVDWGMGFVNYGEKGTSLIGSNLCLSCRSSDSLFSLRSINSIALMSNISIREIGLLYGKVIPTGFGSFSYSGGIGQVDGTYGSTIGLPIEAKLIVSPLSFLAISISLLGNLNQNRSYLGYFAGLQLRF